VHACIIYNQRGKTLYQSIMSLSCKCLFSKCYKAYNRSLPTYNINTTINIICKRYLPDNSPQILTFFLGRIENQFCKVKHTHQIRFFDWIKSWVARGVYSIDQLPQGNRIFSVISVKLRISFTFGFNLLNQGM
jgi:hypothetical protein